MTIEENNQLADVICGDIFEYMEKYNVEMDDGIFIAGIVMKIVCLTLLKKKGFELSVAKEVFNNILEVTKIK